LRQIASIPKVAVVPIFVLWFGSGALPAILTAMTTCIFPIVVNVATGLATTEPEIEDVLKALGASRWQVLWNIGLPRSLPYFFASLKIAVTLAFVGTVLSETVASNRGIGNVMMMASANFDVALVSRAYSRLRCFSARSLLSSSAACAAGPRATPAKVKSALAQFELEPDPALTRNFVRVQGSVRAAGWVWASPKPIPPPARWGTRSRSKCPARGGS
jgi:hypothetical protein